MKISKTQQIGLDNLKNREFDLLICASGYEERCTFLATQIDLEKIQNKVVFTFNNEIHTASRLNNDEFFAEKKFDAIPADADSEIEILSFLNDRILLERGIYSIIIDYSAMSRVWYAAILKYFYFKSEAQSKIRLVYSYTVSKFVESPEEDIYNVHIGPISGFSNLTVPQMPTGLIIGLGYEKSRALGLNEYFDGETYIFYTEGKNSEEYSEEIERNNSQLLSQVKPENIFRYRISDIIGLYSRLFSLCRDLKNDYRVILASCGPKTFALVSLLIALELDNIDVWRISAGKSALPVDKKASGEIVLFEIDLNDEVQILS